MKAKIPLAVLQKARAAAVSREEAACAPRRPAQEAKQRPAKQKIVSALKRLHPMD